MAKVKIHAGDFLKGDSSYSLGGLFLRTAKNSFVGELVQAKDIETVEIASEDAVKRLGGTVGWGVVGGALLGPVGLLAGLLAGGRGKDVTFVIKLKDGRKAMATTDAKTYKAIAAAAF